MSRRVVKSIVAVLAIIALTISDFLILGVNISYALDGLEDQTTKVNEQIDSDAYLKEGEDILVKSQLSKYLPLNENKTLLEQTIISTVKDNLLPKTNERITTILPTIEENYPVEVKVLKNGIKLESEIEYNKQNGNVTINTVNNQEEFVWNDGTDTYQVIAIYDKPIVTGVKEFNTTVSTKLDTKNTEITKNDVQSVNLEQKGQIVSIELSSTESVYKGYMYANTEDETLYNQQYEVEVSNTDEIDVIEISSEGDNFKTEAGNLETKNSTYFKELQINKENMKNIFGENGTIGLQDKNGNQIVSIDSNTESDSNGNIILNKTDENGNKIDLQINDIKLITSKPVTEGVLEITAKKAIKKNAGYDKQTLKTINKLESNIKVKTVKGEEIKSTYTDLKDTITKAKLEISNNNLSTLGTNVGIQITATLITNSNEYDLYKNPKLQIILPNEIEAINITSAKVLYNEGFTTTKNKIETDENGNKVIDLEFEGEQTSFGNDVAEGMQVVIFADITINKLTPSKKTNMKMIYTNENGNEAQYEENLELNINSKAGVFTYTNVSGFNSEGYELETLSNEIPTGNLDIKSDEKIATVNMAVINNYENEISEAVILGKIPGTSQEVIGNNTLEGTFNTTLEGEITISIEEAKVYYSEEVNADVNSNTWKETSEDAKSYKVLLPNNELKSGEKIEFSYKFRIPESLDYNQSLYTNFKIDYTYAGQTVIANSSTILETDKKEINENNSNSEQLNEDNYINGEIYNVIPTNEIQENKKQVVEIAEGVEVVITAVSGEKYLEKDSTINEGQNVKYNITIINNSGKDINNFNLVAEHSNVTFYGIEIVKMGSNEFEEDGTGKVQIDTNWYALKPEEKNKTFNEEKIENGTSKEFTYEFQVKNINEQNATIEGTLNINSDEFNKEVILNKMDIEEGKIALSLLKNNYIEFSYDVEYPETVKLTVKNLSNNEIANQKISIPLNKQITISSVEIEEKEVEYKVENDVLNISIEKLKSNESKDLYITFEINRFDGGYIDLTLEAKTELNNVKYYSNKFIEGVKFNLSKITVKQTAQKENEILKKDDEFDVTLEITNNANFTDIITISKSFPEQLSLVKMSKNGDVQDILDNSLQINTTDNLEAGKTLIYVYTFKVNSNLYDATSITLNFDINANSFYQRTPDIYYDLDNNLYDSNEKDEDVDKEEDKYDDIEDPTNKKETDTKIDTEVNDNGFSVSGKAWLDTNKNGAIDSNEEAMIGIRVYLLNSATGEIVKVNNKPIITVTNNNGIYKFSNIPAGEYIVAFEYNENDFRVTTYKQDGVTEDENSDVISKKINLNNNVKIYAVTDKLKLDKTILNICAGFIKNEIFDLKLDKYVSKIIVQNSTGTTAKSYENTKLAKTEINRKQLINSTVIIEYTINITNEGELSGYVEDLIDYIPKDLKFSSELNKDWYMSTDGNLHNITLSGLILDPGYTTTVKLILTKTMSNNNTGTVINTAEIGKASNKLSINDIDSTPANKVATEDDYGKAEVIISVATGAEVYVTISTIIIIFAITVIGLYIIKKRREGKNE